MMSSQVSEGGSCPGVPLASPLLEYVLEGLQELGQELLQQLVGSLLALGLLLGWVHMSGGDTVICGYSDIFPTGLNYSRT